MFVQQRHQAILQKLHKEKSVVVSELIEMFGVSFETVRRDLEFLEKEGFLKRVHGGAIPAEIDYKKEQPLTFRETKFVEEKRQLVELATRYVTEGQSIALDVSTTNTEFAKALKPKFERLTIITNSLPIANELVEMPHYTIILTGGVIRNEERGVIGDLAEAFVSQFHADLFFMSVSGISLEAGVTDFGIGEVQLKKLMHKNAKRTIALADSSKFEVVSLLKVCGIDEVERYVTDPLIDREIVERYKSHGLEIVYE
ncbi:DeoR/GlpR family DNA-binding transcription regulator [Paenibacillus doosanensis]|uniref:Glucitol operon repressor n=1 Tax=Paenibacillus konkukensis TaxID=2020716 RepID=A0ABY4RYH7_9BACL|nr:MULTISPECIES: DeoR/GlpR family DNA-binding transcription regulator [Paenibacillus]MCS7458879.1 DeoR/GlpR family DNA-binding transcription regulator [Paenibacillus doosanensis]UQZ86593.1 Glucitol operon repressor [Paenibacillus konkukensis]